MCEHHQAPVAKVEFEVARKTRLRIWELDRRAKRFCKRTGKPCVLVPRSGVAAFSRALGQLADPACAGVAPLTN